MENKSTEKWARECQETLGYISGEIYEIVEEILDQLDMATSCKIRKIRSTRTFAPKMGRVQVLRPNFALKFFLTICMEKFKLIKNLRIPNK